MNKTKELKQPQNIQPECGTNLSWVSKIKLIDADRISLHRMFVHRKLIIKLASTAPWTRSNKIMVGSIYRIRSQASWQLVMGFTARLGIWQLARQILVSLLLRLKIQKN